KSWASEPVSRGIVGFVRTSRRSPREHRPGPFFCGGQDDSGCPICHAGVGDPVLVTRLCFCCGVLLTALVGAAPAWGDATFTAESPTTPAKTGQLVKFTATAPVLPASDYSW